MFSTCSTLVQNQAVLPLSYIVSQYSNVRGVHRSKVKCVSQERTASSGVKTPSVVCPESLTETAKKLSDDNFKEMQCLVTPQVLQHIALHGPELHSSHLHLIPSSYCQYAVSSVLKERKKWHESHVSCYSFEENKEDGRNFSSLVREPQVRPLFRFTQKLLLRSQQNLSVNYISHRGYISNRGFKTKQSREREALQHPSVSNRLKDGFKTKERSIFGKSLQQGTDSNRRLKSLLAEGSSEEIHQSIKVGFAEGYLAANRQKDGRTMRWIYYLQYALVIYMCITLLFFLRGIGGSMVKMQFGNDSEAQPEDTTVTFNDVKGVEEAKEELQEIVEFLRTPEKFTSLGAELPKGVLLVGPPGTGKTLIARAVAGEAGVPFFHAAGPEFDELLIGQGAKRIRDLFRTAKMRSPCVIFIDEIDSVGAKRSNTSLHPYANQTVNQLLTEMDGFSKNEGVIVLGATNRRNDLDKALLRPGRFDVEVQVQIPDLAGREEIFDYYLGKLKLGDDIDKNVLSRGTTGFTGADIKNIANQAALRAAADQVDAVSMKHLVAARDKILMGPEKKSRIPDEEANLITAYHEGGHTLVAFYTKDSHPVHKVTIIPRGQSGGHTAFLPAKDITYQNRSQMLASMDSLMGGRAAEEIVFGTEKVTTGASNDLQAATQLATYMVKDVGMGESVGLRTFADNSDNIINAGDSLGHTTKDAIDTEIKKLLQESYERAKAILKAHANEHKALAEALIKYETLDADDIKAVMNGHPVPK